MIEIPRSWARARSADHCSKKSHCSNSTSRSSRASSTPGVIESLGLARHERAIPGVPGTPAVRALERHEEGEFRQPVVVAAAEGLEILALRPRGRALEGREGLGQERLA